MQTNRKVFLELLQRYIDGTCSSEEKQMMDYWYDVLDQESGKKNDTLSTNQLEDLLWAKIQLKSQSGNTADKQETVSKWWQNNE